MATLAEQAAEQHRRDRYCVCPEHRTPMIYWPMGDDHACQDVTCEYGHGVFRALAAQEGRRNALLIQECRALANQVTVALSTEAHHRVIVGGLPYCCCQNPLTTPSLGGNGDATGELITHLLAVARLAVAS